MVCLCTIYANEAIGANVGSLNGVFNWIRELKVTAKVLAYHRPHWAVVHDVIFKKLIRYAVHITTINALEDHARTPFVVVIHTQRAQGAFTYFTILEVWSVL